MLSNLKYFAKMIQTDPHDEIITVCAIASLLNASETNQQIKH